MQDKNLIENLPFDLVQQVSSFLDYKSIWAASKVSKAWKKLFNDNSIWKYQLKKEFDIEDDQFIQFENKINAPNYKQLYVRFYYFSQQRNLPKFIKGIYHDKTQQHLVLLACADNFTCLDEMTREQLYIIAVLGIYAGCFRIPCSFIEKHLDINLSENLIKHAAISGNLKLVQYLLNPENKFGLIPDKKGLDAAAESGNLQLLQYLLNPENKFGLKADHSTLRGAAQSGNLKLVQYLLNPENKLGLKVDQYTLEGAARSGSLQLLKYLLNPENKFNLKLYNNTLNYATQSGNLQLVQYLLNPENKFGLEPDFHTLYFAAISGNLQLVKYLLKPENKFNVKPYDNILNYANLSGNLQLVQYLLNPENKFGLEPDYFTLYFAAQSGNLQLVQYLLNDENKFGLKPDDKTLYYAVPSGNLQLVQYLLSPDNQFSLQVTEKILDSATLTKNLALSEYLLPSHFALQEALKKLRTHDITAAKTLLQQSYTACPSHYNMMSKSILDNPQRFNLNDKSIQCLKEIAKKRFLEDSETSNPKRTWQPHQN